jgi:hypothetical protein
MQTLQSPTQLLIDPQSAPNADPYITELMVADGNIALAAERLHIKPAQLLYEIARDPSSQQLIDSYLRLYSSIKTFQMIGEAQLILMQTVSQLEPAQAARHFTSLLTAIEALTRRSQTTNQTTNNVNLFETALKRLPPEIADHLKLLATPQEQTHEQYVAAIANTTDRHEQSLYNDLLEDEDSEAN